MLGRFFIERDDDCLSLQLGIMMKSWLVPLVLFSMLACSGQSGRASAIVAQETYTGLADWGSTAGQSFLLPPGKPVRAIQLHIAARGGSVRVNLWKTTRAGGSLTRLGASPVATGV